jgi:hypothetical protein
VYLKKTGFTLEASKSFLAASEKGTGPFGELYCGLIGDTWSLVLGCNRFHFADVEK